MSWKALFFGSLCSGTFGLGAWQLLRYQDKVELIALQEEAITSNLRESADPRVVFSQQLTGKFDHKNSLLLGPRGPPPGSLSNDGPNSGRGGGGMASSPQGYYVITPFGLNNGETVLVNRGWVPMPKGKVGGKKNLAEYEKPEGDMNISAVTSRFEEGNGFFSPPAIVENSVKKNGKNTDITSQQKTLLWLQEEAVLRASNQPSNITPRFYKEHLPTSYDNKTNNPPIKPTLSQSIEFKIMPEVHAGYSATWFALSLAGVVMTKKLLKVVPKL